MTTLFDVRTASLALFLLLSAACGREPGAQPASEAAQASDACDLLRLSEPELRKKLAEAQRGNLSAQRDLWGHYQCTDERKAAYWDERLVQQGDAEAMGARSSKLFSAAHRLSDGEPRKLAMLKQAVDLEARARRANAGRVDHVLVNGKTIEVRHSGEPNEATHNMQRELARVSSVNDRAAR